MPAKTTFAERLELGQLHEDELIKLLSLSGVKARQNNDIDVKDIDLYLPVDNIYMDCKYLESPYKHSMENYGIPSQRYGVINVDHVNKYDAIEEDTGKPVWVAFIFNYKDYDIYQLRFFPNKFFVNEIKNNPGRVDYFNRADKLIFDRGKGKTMLNFLGYIREKRISEA